MKKVKTLPVIFRIECDGNPLAVFPTLKEKADGMVTCYAHLGQHDKCCRGYYNDYNNDLDVDTHELMDFCEGYSDEVEEQYGEDWGEHLNEDDFVKYCLDAA